MSDREKLIFIYKCEVKLQNLLKLIFKFKQ